MISLPFRRSRRTPNIAALYGMIVAQARLPAFYRDYGVPDTVEGRLDMLMLHLVLLLRRLNRGHPDPALDAIVATPEGRQLFDSFCRDIDANFREMGVGDLTVPKKMQQVAGALYGRARAYESALQSDGAAELEATIARNVFGTPEPPLGARRLAAYMQEASRRLDAHSAAVLERAELDFPHPDAVTLP